MNTELQTKLSQFLKATIIKAEQWAKVIWVHIEGKRPTFVSLVKFTEYIIKETKLNKEDIFKNLSQIDTANVWENFGKKRIYFNPSDLLEWSKNQARRRIYDKFYFDLKDGFCSQGLTESEHNQCVEHLKWATKA
jgi:hypothetical protein